MAPLYIVNGRKGRGVSYVRNKKWHKYGMECFAVDNFYGHN